MAMNYNQTLSNLRDCISDIQNALNNMSLDGSQSMITWASQLNTVATNLQNLRNQISIDNTDFSNIYDAIVEKGQNPDVNDRDTFAPAILAINGSSTPVLQNITIRATQDAQYISADDGYDGLGTVTIEGVDNTIDSDIKAENIKNGVNILGITGTYIGSGSTPNYQQKTVTPSASEQVISADSEYDALSQVIVNGSSNLSPENIKKDIEIFGVTGTAEVGGLMLNAHPTSLRYAGQQGNNLYNNVLPADGSWTKYVDLKNIDVDNGLDYVFQNNPVVTDIDLTGWNFETKQINSIYSMFGYCKNLQHIRGNMKLNKCSNFYYSFDSCNSLITCPITNFGFDITYRSITLDLSASNVLDAASMITNMDTYGGGEPRILKLHADVLAGLSDEIKALAESKNITLQ